jgi:hypothetical protein
LRRFLVSAALVLLLLSRPALILSASAIDTIWGCRSTTSRSLNGEEPFVSGISKVTLLVNIHCSVRFVIVVGFILTLCWARIGGCRA